MYPAEKTTERCTLPSTFGKKLNQLEFSSPSACQCQAAGAHLGERQAEYLQVPSSILGLGILSPTRVSPRFGKTTHGWVHVLRFSTRHAHPSPSSGLRPARRPRQECRGTPGLCARTRSRTRFWAFASCNLDILRAAPKLRLKHMRSNHSAEQRLMAAWRT